MRSTTFTAARVSKRLSLYDSIVALETSGVALTDAVAQGVDAFISERGKYLPGFGHRFHPVDPRATSGCSRWSMPVPSKA